MGFVAGADTTVGLTIQKCSRTQSFIKKKIERTHCNVPCLLCFSICDVKMSSEHNKSSSDEWHKLEMPYDEFDILVNDIDELELEIIGRNNKIENLSEGFFSSSPFPVSGHIVVRNSRFMVPLVCQWAGKFHKPSVNVWFLVGTGSPFTCLTMKTLKSLLGANKEFHENDRYDIAIQIQNSKIQCQVSKAHFKEVNLLGTDAMKELNIKSVGQINWRQHTFCLFKNVDETIPPLSSENSQFDDSHETKPNMENKSDYAKSQSYEEQSEIPLPELDNSGVITDDASESLPMGNNKKEVTDDDIKKANEERDLAAASFADGNYDDALKHYTNAIELNPGSALLHAKRANVLLKLSKPKAAIADCDKAISINPDAAQGYKFRGRANRLLGNWMEAHKDLATACKIDYDDIAAEWLKEVEPNAKKLQEHNRAKQRRAQDKEDRERRERLERAREANRRAAEEEASKGPTFGDEDKDLGGMPGGMGTFAKLLNDPEIKGMLKEDPTLLTKLMDVMQNPASLMKYLSDPNMQKLLKKFTGGGNFPFSFGGGAGGSSTEQPMDSESKGPKVSEMEENAPPMQPKKAPEPDLD